MKYMTKIAAIMLVLIVSFASISYACGGCCGGTDKDAKGETTEEQS